MKKALIGLVVLIVVALVIALVAGDPRGKAPAVGDALDAKSTVGVFAYENFDQAAVQAVAVLDGLPSGLKTQAPMLSADGLKTYLGFDPASAGEWGVSGIDPRAGVAVVVDAGMRTGPGGVPVPLLALKITDRAKFSAFTAKLGFPLTFEAEQDGITPAKIAGNRYWVGARHGFSFLLEAPTGGDAAQQALKTQFAAFLAADGPTLSQDAIYRDAFAHAGGGGRQVGYGSATAMTDLLDGLLAVAKTDVKYYTDRFPAAGFALADNGFSAQLVASDQGMAVLNKLFRAKRRSKLARFIPSKGWAVFRTAANIPEFIDGLADFIPPSMSSQRATLSMSKMAMAFMGFSYEDLAAAFTGFAMGGVDIASVLDAGSKGPASIRWLAAVGVANEKKADRMLEILTELASKLGGRSDVEAGGGKGYRLGVEGLSVVVVRVDDAILIGPSVAAINEAVATAGGDNLAATDAGKRVDDPDAFYAMSVDLTALLARLEKGDLPLPQAMMNPQLLTLASTLDFYQALRTRPSTFAMTLDGGVRVRSSLPIDPTTLVLLGVGMNFIVAAGPEAPLPAVEPIQAQ